MISSSYTTACYSSPPILFKFTYTVGLIPWDFAFILAFRHSVIRHSCDHASRHSQLWSPKQSLVALALADVTKNSDHNLMHKALSRFCISWVWRWGISTLQVTIPETPKWCGINGPDQHLIWRFRSFHDFTYRDFDILVVNFLDDSNSRSVKIRKGVGSMVDITPIDGWLTGF